MMEVLVTFIVTTAAYAVGLWIALRRVAIHLKGNEAGCRAVTEHVLLPILGRKGSDANSAAGAPGRPGPGSKP